METAETQALTLGEAARRLDASVDSLLELAYRGEAEVGVHRDSGRLLVTAAELGRLQRVLLHDSQA